MPSAYLDISPQFFTEFCKLFHQREKSVTCQIVKDGLPQDTTCQDMEIHGAPQAAFIRLTLVSAHFKEDQVLLPPPTIRVIERE